MSGVDFTALSHAAVVVSDFDAALRRYADLFGLRFAATVAYPGLVLDGEARRPVDVPLTWSMGGPTHLEVIAATPGTFWAEPGQHHVGLWSDDVVADAAALATRGFEVEYTVGGPDRPVRGFAYLRDGDGMRLELTSTRFRPAFADWLAGGELDLA